MTLNSLLRTRAARFRRSALSSSVTLKQRQWSQPFVDYTPYPSLRVGPSAIVCESRAASVSTRLDGDPSIPNLWSVIKESRSRTRGFTACVDSSAPGAAWSAPLSRTKHNQTQSTCVWGMLVLLVSCGGIWVFVAEDLMHVGSQRHPRTG